MGLFTYLSQLNWGTSTGGNPGSAETTSTLGNDPVDVVQPPDQMHTSHLQIARIKNLVLAMSQWFKGGTRLQALAQSSNPFGSGEGGFWHDGTIPKFTTTGGTVMVLASGSAVTLTDGATINTDASTGNVFLVTLGGNRTLANPTNLVSGETFQWIVRQDGTGSRTLAYGNLFKWPSGTAPTLTTTASAVDIISATYDGTQLNAVWQGDFR